MKYNELTITANKDRKRKGRGIAAGQGKTAGRGTKGQGARTGKKLGAMFQGGQRALVQAVPKLVDSRASAHLRRLYTLITLMPLRVRLSTTLHCSKLATLPLHSTL